MSPPVPLRAVKTATVSDGESLSEAVYCEGLRLAAIVVPSGWNAADITFQGSVDGTNWYDLHEPSGDTEVTVQAGASRYIVVADPAAYEGLMRLKVRSGTSGTPVNQTGDVTVQLVFVD